MKRPVLFALLAAILVIAALALALPHTLLAPGAVAAVHHNFERNCFACHAPFAGASAERCMACHKVEFIGIKTTAGLPIHREQPTVAFHRYLSEKDCLSCHGEHEGVRSLLAGHRFQHELLMPEVRQRCESCHGKPQDELHMKIAGGCSQCHTQKGWKPANFDHDRYFPLVGEHRTECATCHASGNYNNYSCYGCHAHSPARVRAEHAEEGIRQIDNCIECHRGGTRGEGEGREGGD